MENVMRAVRDHIKTCSFLEVEEGEGFGVDFLAENGTAYMIEAVPAAPVIKKYLHGDTQRQFVFAFSTRESYGADAEQNLGNLEMLAKFAAWLEDCTDKKTLPDLGEGKKSLQYEVLTTGYAFQTSASDAQYRIQCRLIYFQEKGE